MPGGFALYRQCYGETIRQRSMLALAFLMALGVLSVGATVLYVFINMFVWDIFPLLTIVIFFANFILGMVLVVLIYLFLSAVMLSTAILNSRGEPSSVSRGWGMLAGKRGVILRSFRQAFGRRTSNDMFFMAILINEDFMGYWSTRERSHLFASGLSPAVTSADSMGSFMNFIPFVLFILLIPVAFIGGTALGLSGIGQLMLVIIIVVCLLWLFGLNTAAVQTLRARYYVEVTSTPGAGPAPIPMNYVMPSQSTGYSNSSGSNMGISPEMRRKLGILRIVGFLVMISIFVAFVLMG